MSPCRMHYVVIKMFLLRDLKLQDCPAILCRLKDNLEKVMEELSRIIKSTKKMSY